MKVSMLRDALAEQGVSVGELARRLDISSQTLYSILKKDNQKVDFDLMLRICRELELPVERFTDGEALPDAPNVREWSLMRRYRRLDEPGRELTDLVVDAELRRCGLDPEGGYVCFSVRSWTDFSAKAPAFAAAAAHFCALKP